MTAPIVKGYGRQQTACHSPCTGIFACYCRICRFALYSAHGNGDSKWYFELPHLKYTVSPLLFVCPPFISIHFRTPPKKAEPVPKPSIRKGIAIMLKILRLFGSLFRKPRLTRFTTCLPPLNNASGAKFAMRLCAVGCTASDLRIKKESDLQRRRPKSTGALCPADAKTGKASGQGTHTLHG